MRVISRKILKDFYSNLKYADSKTAIEVWFKEAQKADWLSPSVIKQKFGNASFLIDNRVIFNIHGNKYRLSVMEDQNLKSVDLGNLIGGRSRATEILNKKRKLTLEMIRSINEKLGIPTEILIREYKLNSGNRSKQGSIRKKTPSVA